jgi:hypothetical protein
VTIFSRVGGYAWLVIVDSRYDHLIYWIFSTQWPWISTVHTLASLRRTNPSLVSLCALSGWFLNPAFLSCILSRIRYSFSLAVASGTVLSFQLSWFPLASCNLSSGSLLSLGLVLRPTVSRPVCLGIKHPSGAYDQVFLLLSDSCRFVDLGSTLWRGDGSVVYNCCWFSPAQSFSGPSPVELVAIFYCLRFETCVFVAFY